MLRWRSDDRERRARVGEGRDAQNTTYPSFCAWLMISPGLLRATLCLASTLEEIKRGLSEWWSGWNRGQMEEEEGSERAQRR